MAIKQSVRIKLPIMAKEFSASYSKVEKPTGVQYLLLTLMSMRSSRSITWREMIKEFGIPDEIYEKIFKSALKNMAEDTGMITGGGFDIDDEMSDTALTKMGREAFEKGVISNNPERFSGTVYFLPAREQGRKYLKDTESNNQICDKSGFDEGRFSDIAPNDSKIENKLVSNKALFGVDDPEADIFDIDIAQEYKMFCYSQNIRFDFDPTTGDFTILPGEIDESFIKNRFDADYIIHLMDSNIFELKSKDILFVQWNNEMPEWDRYSYMLPAELDLNSSRLVLFNNTACRSSRYIEAPIESDIVSIDSDVAGYEYYLVKKEVHISGFDSSSECTLIVKKQIEKEEISRLVKETIGSIDVKSIEDLKRILGLAAILKDNDYSAQLVEEYLLHAKNLESTITSLQEFRKEKWYSVMPDVVEKSLVARETPIDDVVSILNRTKTTIDGSSMATSRKTDNKLNNEVVADTLLTVSRNVARVIDILDVGESMTDHILSGVDREYNSVQFRSMSNASKNLSELKRIFGMKSFSDYNFDIDNIDDQSRAAIGSHASTFSKEIDSLKSLLPSSQKMKDVEDYRQFFNEMSISLKNNIPIEKSSPRSFGIQLGIRLEGELRAITDSGSMSSMIDSAFIEKKISENDYKTLQEFREFRNLCAHSITVPVLSNKKRKEWVDVVKRINPSVNKKGGKK